MITENLSTLKIHKLTQEQYNRELTAGNIDETALYLTPDEEIDLSGYATTEAVSSQVDTHNTSEDAHSDIRLAIEDAQAQIDALSTNGVEVYVQDDEPTDVKDGDVWIDSDADYTASLDADTVDGKHADEFAVASDVEALKTLVGDTSVSTQISEAVDGVTSSIQTQLDDKLSLSGGTLTGDLVVENRVSCSGNDMYVTSENGSVYLENENGSLLRWFAYEGDNYSDIFRSEGIDAILGSDTFPWYRVFCASSTLSTSDEREKSDITSISDYPVMFANDAEGNVFEQLFDKLNPVTFTLNIEKTNDLHIGFIAQDIEAAANELGISIDDLGFVFHSSWTDEETGEEKDRYSLGYEEFIALNTHMIQKQKAKIEEQQSTITSLEERIAKLEALINAEN